MDDIRFRIGDCKNMLSNIRYVIFICLVVLASLTLRLLMSHIYIYIYIYIYGAPVLDVSRSHTTTQHSR